MAEALRVQILRGERVESEHLVDIVVLNQKGGVQEIYGNGEVHVAPRSAIKPFQALLLASSKWAEKDPRAESRLAIACASHWGGFNHLTVVREWLRDLKLTERDLACGPHWPKDESEKNRLLSEHRKPEKIHNNCSGKHAGLLALCLDRGYATANYQRFDHPVQQEIRQLFSKITGFNWEKAPYGVDGCGIPTSFVPLMSLAKLGLIFFIEDLSQFKGGERIRRAMGRYPNLVSGEGDLGAMIMKDTGGKILVKGGAEGNFWGVSFKTGMTFFLKVRDGAQRAAEVAVLDLLRRTGDWDDAWKASFEKRSQWPLDNWSGTLVGKMTVN